MKKLVALRGLVFGPSQCQSPGQGTSLAGTSAYWPADAKRSDQNNIISYFLNRSSPLSHNGIFPGECKGLSGLTGAFTRHGKKPRIGFTSFSTEGKMAAPTGQ